MNEKHYRHLLLMAALSFASMYVLMYAMVNAAGNVYSNLNQLYMAGLMTAPMVIIELSVMRGMYHDKRSNALIVAASSRRAGSSCSSETRRECRTGSFWSR